MTTMKLNAEQRVQKAHVWLMAQPQYCLYSGIFMFGKTSIEENVPTACTNGRDTMYGRAFVDKQKDPELRGLVLHENLHKAFRHLTTWKDLKEKNGKLANMACDYVINLMIVDSDPEGKEVRLPEGGLLDERFRGMDAGEVFRILEKRVRVRVRVRAKVKVVKVTVRVTNREMVMIPKTMVVRIQTRKRDSIRTTGMAQRNVRSGKERA
jgi:predicted metal-dependent peptidase